MRIATLILGLFLMLILGVQSCVITGASSIAGATGTAGTEKTTTGGAAGLFMAFLFLVGAAFVIGFPTVSFIVFIVAGLIGIGMGQSGPFTDLKVWGFVSLILASLSFLGRREKRKSRKTVELT